MKPGLYLAHKPVGVSSFSVVQQARPPARADGEKPLALCHGGTLDPFASGLLLLLAGQATRLFERLHVLPKVYEATVAWGVETDNGDPTGRALSRADASALTPQALDEALGAFVGWTEQVPHATSAKKIGGEPAYRKAHRGEEVTLPPSRVYLHEARWVSHALPATSALRVVVRGGFYVRALARDLGRRLGVGAHLAALHRTAIGPWLDPAGAAVEERPGIFGADLVPWLRRRALSTEEADAVRAWKPLAPAALADPPWRLPEGFVDEGPPVALVQKRRLIGLGAEEDGQLLPKLNFWGGL